MKIGIVISEYYWEDVTSKMLEEALKAAEDIETEVIKVPGSFDIPLPVKRFLKREDIDGVVTLGAIVRGQTDHDGVIGYALAKTLMELSLEFEKPVMLGVNGPRMARKDAIDRIPRAGDVMRACMKIIKNT